MSLRDEVLRDFRASFDRLQTVRACGDTEVERQELRHAQRNFDAAAESLARLVPKLIDGPDEVGAFLKQRLPQGLGQHVTETVSMVKAGWVASLTVTAEGLPSNEGLIKIHRDHRDLGLGDEQIKIS